MIFHNSMARSQRATFDGGRKKVKGREKALHREGSTRKLTMQGAHKLTCSMCHEPSNDLQPGIGFVGKHLIFCPTCKAKQVAAVHQKEALYHNPITSKYMQKWIKWDKDDTCRCQIQEPETECYRGDVYVLETPEESGTMFGKATAIVHIKCNKPVYNRDIARPNIPSRQEIELR